MDTNQVNEQVNEFVNSSYTPLTIKFIFQILLTNWIFTLPSLFIGSKIIWINNMLLIGNAVYLLFCILCIIIRNRKETKYIFDGASSLYISLVLLFWSYKGFTYAYGVNTVVLFLLLLLWIVVLIGDYCFVKHLIRKSAYQQQVVGKSVASVSLIGAVAGMALAKCFLPSASNEEVGLVFMFIALFLSLFLSLGSFSLLKFYYYKKYGDGQ